MSDRIRDPWTVRRVLHGFLGINPILEQRWRGLNGFRRTDRSYLIKREIDLRFDVINPIRPKCLP